MTKKILVIEDEEIIGSMLKDSLELMGYSVSVANSGREGLSRAEHVRPDLITLDIMMPGLDGIQVLKVLKENEITKDIPVILVSVASGEFKREGLNLGAVAFFKKPLDFKALHNKIKSLTEKRKVLIVEDNPEILRLLEMRLENMGYVVSSAFNGRSALAKVKEEVPDIILMDIVLPDVDGIEVTKLLKKDDATATIPVIAFSGYISDDISNKQVIGVDRFIGKRFSVDELAEEVDIFFKKT